MYVVIFSLYTEFFFDSVQKIFAFNFNFLFKFSSFIFVLMPRIDLLCCCGDQFFYLFFKISCWKKKQVLFLFIIFLCQEHTKICEMRGVENNATRKYNGKRTTSNKKKKFRGRKYFFVVSIFAHFSCFKSRAILYTFCIFMLICKRGTK